MSIFTYDQIMNDLLRAEQSAVVFGDGGSGYDYSKIPGFSLDSLRDNPAGEDYLRYLYEAGQGPGAYDALKQDGAITRQGPRGGGFLHDMIGSAVNHFENMGSAWKKDPERVVLGINTPLESELWGNILQKDYRPTTDMYGGDTKYDYETAQQQGLDTEGTSLAHMIARTAVMAAGGAAANNLAGGTTTANAGAPGYGFEAGTAASGAGSGAGTGTGGNSSFWDNTYAANDTGTMTDAGADIGGDWTFDDFSGEWVPDSGGGGVGGDVTSGGGETISPQLEELNWQGQSQGQGGAGGFSLSDLTKYGQKAKDLAAQFGITPAAALKALMGAAGKAAPAALGVIGANQQANSLQALAEKYSAYGEPSRARYEASYAPGFSMANEPGYKDALDQTTKSFLHKASMGGNPAASPNAWQQTLKDVNSTFAFPALQSFRGMNANTGGLASFAPASVNASNSAIGAQKSIFDAIGGGINDIFNVQPAQPTLEDIVRALKTTSGKVA